MSEPFIAKKAFDLSATALGKSTSATLKGLAVLGVIGVMGWSIYITLIKPHFNPLPTTTQTGNITNYNYEVKQTFGCMRVPAVKERK